MRFAFDDQIAGQPAAVAAALARDDAPALDPARPVVLAALGSSLHAARVAACWLSQLSSGAVQARAADAHQLALRPPLRASDQGGLVSHRGATGSGRAGGGREPGAGGRA